MLNNFLRANEGKFQNDTNLDAGYYPGRVVITPLDENSVSVRALQAKMNGGTVEDFDPLNYKLLESDLSFLDECLQAPYDDLGIENWKTEPTGFGRLYSLLMGSAAVEEAAMLDGAGPWYIQFHIIVPLSKPVIATVALFTIVSHWNDFFQGLVLSTDEKFYPLQTYIKQLIFQVDTSTMTAEQIKQASMMSNTTLNAAKIFISMVPVLCIYPFLQKYFVTGIQLGGEAPHLGMVLTKGSLAGYSIQRNLLSQSNDRGCFLLHPDAMELAAGETGTLEWIIFRHEGKTDFFKKLAQYHPHFVEVTADRYVLFEGEKNVLRIRPAFAAEQVTVDGEPLPKTDGEYRLAYTARETGEKVFAIQVDGINTWCRTYVQENIHALAGKRCAFLAQHQQYCGPVVQLKDAYLAYDNEEDLCVYRPENDFNGGRERIGMGCLMARYLSNREGENDQLLRDSLERYRAYVLRELVDGDTGKVFNDIGWDDSYKRLYNAP